MRRITAWESKPKDGEWEHNHIEFGWSERDVPHGTVEQAKAWRGKEWRRIHCWLTDDQRVTNTSDLRTDRQGSAADEAKASL